MAEKHFTRPATPPGMTDEEFDALIEAQRRERAARPISEARKAPALSPMSFEGLSEVQRLAALASMLGEIVSDVHAARQTLFDDQQLSDQAYVTAQLLGKVGWMAERAATLAGETTSIYGGADDWLLSPRTQELLQAAEVDHE